MIYRNCLGYIGHTVDFLGVINKSKYLSYVDPLPIKPFLAWLIPKFKFRPLNWRFLSLTFFRQNSGFWGNFKIVLACRNFSLRDRISRIFMRFFSWYHRIFSPIFSLFGYKLRIPTPNTKMVRGSFLTYNTNSQYRSQNWPKWWSNLLDSTWQRLELISRCWKHIFRPLARQDSLKIDDFTKIWRLG